MKHSFVRFTMMVMLSFFVISCGKAPSNVLDAVQVKTETIDDEIWMTFTANLNLGAMSFASISLPILHPRRQNPVGELELTSALGGANLIKVSVNVTELADIDLNEVTLPNGNMVPLIANNKVISIDVGRGAQVYLVLTEKVVAIGAAVPIRAFDSIGSKLPGLNIFPVVNINNVIGTAGIFTGADAGQSGIAVVADVTKVVNLQKLMPEVSAPALIAIQEEEAVDPTALDYDSHSASKSVKRKLDDMLYSLNEREAVLRH